MSIARTLTRAVTFAFVLAPLAAQGLELPDPAPRPVTPPSQGQGGQQGETPPRVGVPQVEEPKGGLELPKPGQGAEVRPGPGQGEARGPSTPRLLGKRSLDLFQESLRSREELTREELIAEYSLLSSADQQRLLERADTLPSKSLGRLAQIWAALPEPMALGVLLRALRKRSHGRDTQVIAESAVTLAGDRAKPMAFDFLASRRRLVRAAGERILLRYVQPEDLPVLRELFDDASGDARLSALRVLGAWLREHPEQPLDLLVEALDSADGSVRRTAAETFLAFEAQRVLPVLKERAAKPRERGLTQKGFLLASVLLARLELLRGEDLLPEPAKPWILACAQSADPLERAVAAIVAGVGRLLHPEPVGRDALARAAVSRLVEELLAVTAVDAYYDELALCHDQARLVLRLLAGEDFGNDSLRWSIWWRDVKDRFEPFARDLSLGTEAARSARLVLAEGLEPKYAILGPEADEAEMDGVRFRLEAEEMATLFQTLKQRGYLDLAERLRANALRSERFTLTVQARALRAQDAYYDREDPRLLALRHVLEELFRREAWQEFAPKSLTAQERRVWWSEQKRFYATENDVRRRTAHTLELCAAVLGELAEGPRRRALGLLLDEAGREDSGLGPTHAQSLLRLVQDPDVLPTLERTTVYEVLAQIEAPGLFEQILQALRRLPVADVQPTLARVLALAGREHIGSALRDPNVLVRAAAAAEMHNLRDERLHPLLIERLGDESRLVQRQAITSVGRLGLREALPDLLTLAEGEDPELRREALVAMAAIGGAEVYETLYAATTREDDADKLAAVRGLMLLRDERTGDALLGLATAHYPQPIGLLAFDGLRTRGGPVLRGKLRDAFFKTANPDLKRELVYTLASMGEPEVFRPLLQQLANTGQQRLRTLRHLAAISGIDWTGEPDAVARYRAWFEQEGDGRPRDWFLQALTREGIPSRLTTVKLLPGAEPEVIDELASILETAESWTLRMQANFLLREITLQDYGSLEPDTALGMRQVIADRYRSFARAQAAERR